MTKIKTAKLYQQGDVLIEAATAPKGASVIKPSARGHVLEQGATGHTHLIARPANTTLMKKGDELFIVAKKAFTVSHEEHKPITIPKGAYRVRGVREYDHFEEEARRVID